ncbi:MAG: glycosyltransferase [bacterium]|nr:glycosyltransferase [bacterium]
MKKILLVTCTSNDTISACAYNLYKALKDSGKYDIYVYSIDQRDSYSYPFEKVFPCPAETRGLRGKMAIIQNLRQVKKILSIDCSISTLTAFTAYNLLSSYHDAKYAIYHAPAKQSLLYGWTTYLFCLLTIFISNIFCKQLWAVSEEALDDINRYSMFKKKNHKVYNIHNYDKIAQLADEEIETGKLEPYVLFVGSLYDLKGFDRLLRAFQKVAQDCVHLKLLVCGSFRNEAYEKGVLTLIEKLKLENRTVFLGYQNNPYKYMKHSVAIVSSSYTESLPGVIIEALSIGVPVISTNSSKGIWEIFSVLDRYDEKLSKIYKTECGYITPNISKQVDFERCDLNGDEICLADAITSMVKYPIHVEFDFKEQCEQSYILKKINL